MTTENSSPQEVPPPAEGTAAPSSAPEAGPGAGDRASASRKRWIAAAGTALAVALFAVPLLRGPADRHATDAEHTGTTPVPEGATCAAKPAANLNFTLKDVNGTDVRLADYKGKVVLLNFWATWCGPCKLEIPEFVEAYERYRDKGFVILGVLSEDDPTPAELRTFMTEFKMNYPVFQEHQPLAEANGELWALPTSFIIDRKGAICTKHMGAMSREMLEREIKGLL
jgi:peroxiredoxin